MDNQLKVLHFYKTYWPDTFGGVERMIDGLAAGCVEHGIETGVLTLSPHPDGSRPQMNGAQIFQIKRHLEFASTPISFHGPAKLRDLAGSYDVIHYHSPWPFGDICHLLTRSSARTVLTYHADPLGSSLLEAAYKPLLSRFIKSVDRLVATSPEYASSSKALKTFNDKTTIIPIGLPDVNKAVSTELDANVRSRFGDDYFLFIGVMRGYKGLEYLIDAARSTDANIVIGGDGRLRAKLEKLARQFDLKNVHFIGHVDEDLKAALLKNCRVFVFPSHTRAEAFGLSLIEAARAGKPMISCRLQTGTSFVNRDQETGLEIEPANADALADAINFFADNREAAEIMGQNARQHYLANLTQKAMARSYAGLYRELAKA